MSDTQHEFYIRSASDDEARGPFTFDQLAQLAVRGQLTRDMLYYEAESEQWVAIGGNAAISSRLFSRAAASLPPDARQRSGKDGEADTSSGGGDAAAPSTPSTSPVPPRRAACAVLLLAGALAFTLPFFLAGAGTGAGAAKILTHPFVLFGAVDLVLALAVLSTGAGAGICRAIRIRAALGLGFFPALFWLQSQIPALFAAILAGVCLWSVAAARNGKWLAADVAVGICALVLIAVSQIFQF